MRRITVGLLSMATGMLVLVAPQAANAADPSSAAPNTVYSFPSATSTVVGSVGFVDTTQVGYFWSMARGDSVTETFAGPPASVKKAKIKFAVVSNNLTAGNHVDWTLSINGKDVGSFSVTPGAPAPINKKFKFKKIKGPNYIVKIRVTNEVPGGGGSVTLAYAGAFQHSITLT